MPYTPPSHRSPASSASNSPDVSRRSSIASASGQRPSLPRSASYLNKHRRTPTAVSTHEANATPTPPYGNSDDEPKKADPPSAMSSNPRRTPPPATDDRVNPNAALISPPDSASSGSEDEGHPEIRGRKLGKLREAVSQIPQPRTPSPTNRVPLGSGDMTPTTIMRTSFSATDLDDLPKSGRKLGHSRSATEPNAQLISHSTVVSDDSEEDLKKPAMVRKKSGELVRPALRPAHRRPSSMPGTPVFAKVVHFDSHLEHVRHFLQVDRPLAVSASSSPVDTYDSDTEYPFHGAEKKPAQRSPPFEWELVTNNFPHESAARKALPVRLERVWLSNDQKSMLGSIAVNNMAFHKLVVCRFTLDYWKTTSEVVAEFSSEIRARDSSVSQDRFTFSIKLSDTIHLESKTLFFCIRYTVNGQEFWDNNGMANFQIDFKKKHTLQNGKNHFQGAASRTSNGLPRSKGRHAPSPVARPSSVPPAFDEFGKKARFNFDDDEPSYIGESGVPGGLRLKTKSTSNLASDNFTRDMSSPSGAAFANRYDFGASLNAAVQAAKDTAGKDKDALYMKRNVRSSSPGSASNAYNHHHHHHHHHHNHNNTNTNTNSLSNNHNNTPAPANGVSQVSMPSPSVGLTSSSYEELVKKYCFFGSKQQSNTAQSGASLSGGGYDGLTPELEPSMPIFTERRTGPAMHHGLHIKGLSPSLPIGTASSIPFSTPGKPFSSTAHAKEHQSLPIAIGNPRPRSPSVTMTGTSPNDRRFHIPPQRFLWGGEAHATAIRG